MKVYLDGEFVEEKEAKVSVFDHGLLYGDGVFEGIKAYKGFVFKLDEHLERLYESAKGIFLEIPLSKEEMKNAVLETLRINKLKDAYIRLVVTRGVGDLGLDPRKCQKPTIFIITREWKTLHSSEIYEQGARAIVVSVRSKDPQSLPPNIKSLNYLPNILARIQANFAQVDEAIMLDVNGNVSEGSAENIFIVKDEKLSTPPTITNLPGITRKVVMELAKKEGYEVSEEFFNVAQLYSSDEVFLTGTAAEIVPVVEIDGRKIGDGKPGPITKKLCELFSKITGLPETGTPI